MIPTRVYYHLSQNESILTPIGAKLRDRGLSVRFVLSNDRSELDDVELVIILRDGIGHAVTTRIRDVARAANVPFITLSHKSSTWDPQLSDLVNKIVASRKEREEEEQEEASTSSRILTLRKGANRVEMTRTYMRACDSDVPDEIVKDLFRPFFEQEVEIESLEEYLIRVQQTAPIPEFGEWARNRGSLRMHYTGPRNNQWSGSSESPSLEVLPAPEITVPPEPAPSTETEDTAIHELLEEAGREIASLQQELDKANARANELQVLASNLRTELSVAQDKLAKFDEQLASSNVQQLLHAFKLLYQNGLLTAEEVMQKMKW